jgi:hypothetical protein
VTTATSARLKKGIDPKLLEDIDTIWQTDQSPVAFMLDGLLNSLTETYLRKGKIRWTYETLATRLGIDRKKVGSLIRTLYNTNSLREEIGRRLPLTTIDERSMPTEIADSSPSEPAQAADVSSQNTRDGRDSRIAVVRKEKRTSLEAALTKIREASDDMILSLPEFYRGTALQVWDGGIPKASSVPELPVITKLLYNPPCPTDPDADHSAYDAYQEHRRVVQDLLSTRKQIPLTRQILAEAQAAYAADASNRAAYDVAHTLYRDRLALDEAASSVIGTATEEEWPSIMVAHPEIDWETWALPEPSEPLADLVPRPDGAGLARLEARYASFLKDPVCRRIVERLDQEQA